MLEEQLLCLAALLFTSRSQVTEMTGLNAVLHIFPMLSLQKKKKVIPINLLVITVTHIGLVNFCCTILTDDDPES